MIDCGHYLAFKPLKKFYFFDEFDKLNSQPSDCKKKKVGTNSEKIDSCDSISNLHTALIWMGPTSAKNLFNYFQLSSQRSSEFYTSSSVQSLLPNNFALFSDRA